MNIEKFRVNKKAIEQYIINELKNRYNASYIEVDEIKKSYMEFSCEISKFFQNKNN